MKNALKKTLVGIVAAMSLAGGAAAASALSVDASSQQADYKVCNPDPRGPESCGG